MQRLSAKWTSIIACVAGTFGVACSGSGDTFSTGQTDGAAAADSGTAGTNAGGTGGKSSNGSGGSGARGSGGRAGTGATAGGGGSSGSGGGAGGSSGNGSGAISGAGGLGQGGNGGVGAGGVAQGGNGGVGQAGNGGTGQGGTGNAGGSTSGGSDGGPRTDGSAGGGAGRDGGGAGNTGNGGAGGSIDAGKPCSSNADCDDTVFCNGDEQCISGHCRAGTPVNCPADNVRCTLEFCSEGSKQCESVPQDSDCSDSTVCNGSERCDPTAGNANPTTGCVAGTPLNCNDGIGCTTDTCDAQDGCKHAPDDTACSNQNACDGIETCNPSSGCQAGTPPAPCDDQIACTTDTCDPATGLCSFKADNSKCSNGQYCDGVEQCNPASGCVAGTPIVCPNADGVACTEEKCDEASDSCPLAGVPNHSLCPSGQVCTASGCTPGKSCTTNANCSDGLFCTGVETCVGGICQGGTAVNCDDGVDCTVDSCDETANACKHVATNSLCDDKNVCNGTETCNATTGCQFGTTLNCPDDGASCTFETCVPGVGCQSFPDDTACNDGKFCNGTEKCAPKAAGANTTTGCVPGTAVTCPSDNIACTTELCDETTKACIKKTNDGLCGCGETCDPTTGCGKNCQVRACAGHVYACGDCVDNDGDCAIDSRDTQCLGACQNNESGFKGDIPGQNSAPCKADCYFDNDTGSGNDDCYWTHECDPHEVTPAFDPEGSKCKYDPNAKTPGSSGTCTQHFQTQSATCHSICDPLTPNGCDCFGCCTIPGAPTDVYLGSEDSSGNGSCNLTTLADPTKCRPCLKVQACNNPCDHCELCVGKPTLPPDCTTQQCPAGVQKCGLPTDPPCSDGQYCVTGCCQNLL